MTTENVHVVTDLPVKKTLRLNVKFVAVAVALVATAAAVIYVKQKADSSDETVVA